LAHADAGQAAAAAAEDRMMMEKHLNATGVLAGGVARLCRQTTITRQLALKPELTSFDEPFSHLCSISVFVFPK